MFVFFVNEVDLEVDLSHFETVTTALWGSVLNWPGPTNQQSVSRTS